MGVPEPPLTLHEKSVVFYVGDWTVKKIIPKTKSSEKISAIKPIETWQKRLMSKQFEM